MKILFVCASNICRSPFCEYMLKRELETRPNAAHRVEWVRSAAVLNPSARIHPKAELALSREGFDKEYVLQHKPAYLLFDYKRFKEADVIIGMIKLHKWLLPVWLHKKFTTISELVDGEYKGVPDPYLMKDMNDYYAVMDTLKDYVVRYADKLEQEDKREADSIR